ncbi:hypothetical protein DFH06DRAFT_1185019 [Mycena polygramma]|nr:hypothetical protein DFH06DRAFT_1185019 [Mycena polygramma]
MLKRVSIWSRQRPRKPGADVASNVASARRSRLDAVTLGVKAFLAVCDAPVVGVVKPVAALAVLGCETAQAVRSAKDVEVDLRWHAQRVQDAVIKRSIDDNLPSDLPARAHLENVLNEIDHYLELTTGSPTRCGMMSRSVSAARQLERMTEMRAQLGDAENRFDAAAQLYRLQKSVDGLDSSPSQDQIALQKLPLELIAFVHRMDGPTKTATVIFCIRADATEVLRCRIELRLESTVVGESQHLEGEQLRPHPLPRSIRISREIGGILPPSLSTGGWETLLPAFRREVGCCQPFFDRRLSYLQGSTPGLQH